MTVSWEEQCPCCEAERATVQVSTEHGKVVVGSRCAGLLIALGKLMGLNTRKRPLLEAVRG